MKPGLYLRLRREKAGYTLRELAYQFASPPTVDAETAERMLAAAEIEQAPLDASAQMRLALFVPFDRAIYGHLIEGLPAASVCGTCGCSWHDPCRVANSPCAWANPQETLCTACAVRKAA